jgi:outer membrane receptor protein involved in Fe transport
MRRASYLVILGVFLYFWGGSTALYGQATTTATVLGTVTDRSGGIVPGVSVRATAVATGEARDVTTDADGNYIIPLLSVGEYTLTFDHSGFQTRLLAGITLQIGQNARIDVTLEIGSPTQKVQVVGHAPLLKAASSEIGEVIEHQRVVDLPLNGRQFVQLALLTPTVNSGLEGSVGSSMQQTGPKLSARGAREYDNSFTIDGVTAQDHFFNTLSVSPSVDALEEFKVETSNYGADKGDRSGAQVNIVTRSGTNKLHGTLFEFLRNDVLDAKNFFDPPEIPPYRQNQFGGTIGGPVVKDRVFFFSSYEGLRIRQSLTRVFSVPSSLVRSGDLSSSSTPIIDPTTGQPFAGNIIPSTRINPASQEMINLWPLPNLPGEFQNFVGTPTFANDGNQIIGRGDVNAGANDRVFGRFIWGKINALNPFGAAQFGTATQSSPLPGFGLITRTIDKNLAVGFTHIFSPNFISTFRFGFNRVVGGQLHENHGDDFNQRAGIQGTTTDEELIGIPSVSAGIYSTVGDQTVVLNSGDNTYQFIEGITWVRGRHEFNIGGRVERVEFDPNLDVFSRGSFVFTPRYTVPGGETAPSPLSAFADFLLGYPTQGLVGLGDARVFGRTWNYSTYFQDNWKVTPRLTVNLGVRYDYYGTVGSAMLRGSTFDFSSCGQLFVPNNCPNGIFVVPSKDGQIASDAFAAGILQRMPFPVVGSEEAGFPRSLFDPDYNNFAPRAGFAYRLGDKTVVRASYGIFYNLSQFNQVGQESFNPPFFDTRFLLNDATPQTATSAPTPANTIETILLGQGLGSLRIGPNERQFPAAYSNQWTFNIQRNLTPNVLLEVAYLGSNSHKLLINIDYNQPIPGPGNGRQGAFIPELGPMSVKSTGGQANYHAMFVRAQKRFSHGLAFAGSYTWSKSLDYASAAESYLGGGGVQDNRDRRNNYGPSNFDIRNNLILNYMYEFPLGPGRTYLKTGLASHILGGWQAEGILLFHTGQPLTPSLIQNRSNAGGSRPDLIGNPNLPKSQRSAQAYYDSSAFGLPAQFTFGNAGRGTLTAPGFNNVDFSLIRNIAIAEKQALQFRAEFFNLFNHTNFDFPEIRSDSPNFGRIFSAKFPRQIQFGLKYIF